MSTLKDLSKLSKITLPSGTTYRLQDNDLREMVGLSAYVINTAYNANEIIYNQTEDALYRVMTSITAEENTAWSDITSKVQLTNITGEIEDRYNEIKAIISNAIHYVGYTTTPLTDGATTNPIIINGNEYTAVAGDLVIYQINGANYQSGVAYAKNDLIVYDNKVYRVTKAITAANNTQFSDVDTVFVAENGKEFIFDGTRWNEFGSTGILKALAFADTASGTYTRPTGTGTVTVNQYDITGGNDSTITGEGTTDIEYVNGLTGTVEFNTNAIKDANLTYGETTGKSVSIVSGISGTQAFNTNAIDDVDFVDGANTGKSVVVVNGITGTTVFNTDAIKDAELTGTKSFNVDGISNAELTSTASTNTVVTGLTGTTSFATWGLTTTVDNEELTFSFTTTSNATFGVDTTELGITTTAATFGTVGITYTAAATNTFEVTNKTISLTTNAATTSSFTVTTATLGLTTTDADKDDFEVTTKHIHITHTTPTANVTVDSTTDTVTVYPDTAPTTTI